MDKEIVRILQKPLYPYVYGFTFIIYKTSRYLPSFSLLTAGIGLLLFCVTAALLHFLLTKIGRSAYTGINIVILTGSVLHVAGIAQLFGYSYSYIPVSFYIVFYTAIIASVIFAQILLSKLTQVYAPAVNKIFNIFLLISSIVFISNSYFYGDTSKESARQSSVAANAISTGNQKDIVWLLTDEYASSASLQQQFDFKNPLDSMLRAKDFFICSSMKSRFNNTLFTLNAVFNMDDSVKPSSFYAGIHTLENSLWASLLEKQGYRFINLGIFTIGTHLPLSDRSGYPDTYMEQLISGTLFHILHNRLKYTARSCDEYNHLVLKKLGDTLRAPAAGPKFIWAHISVPHEPFCRGSHGEFHPGESFDESDSAAVKKKYVEYLQYGNSLIMKLLNEHPELSEKIVIIAGDHGPRHSYLKDKSYQFWPFAAVHIPGGYDTTSLRNLQYISQLPAFIIKHISH